jgi:hypothetical protein
MFQAVISECSWPGFQKDQYNHWIAAQKRCGNDELWSQTTMGRQTHNERRTTGPGLPRCPGLLRFDRKFSGTVCRFDQGSAMRDIDVEEQKNVRLTVPAYPGWGSFLIIIGWLPMQGSLGSRGYLY